MKSFGAPVSKDITVSMTENNGTNSDNAFHVSTNTDKVTLNFKSDNKSDTSFNYYINGK